MIVLDTNIFIYLADRTLQGTIIGQHLPAHASVTRIEALGFDELSVAQASLLRNLFARSTEFDLSPAIVERAIQLRQVKKMRLGDAIIAATALEADAELWTANTRDFQGINDLRIHNPLPPRADTTSSSEGEI